MFAKETSVLYDSLLGALSWLVEILYVVAVFGVSLHGLNALWLTWLLRRHPQAPTKFEEPSAWPRVSVQLPVYNERHVVERLIDAVAGMDYPADRLQIQVLDDSTDATSTLVDQRARLWQGRGVDVQAVRRKGREGYKAGALAHALPLATGELIAIFDADFLPPADFLKRAVGPFSALENGRVAFVQGRWEHLNRDYSILTNSQALALDGHFGVEQPARCASGLAFGFNGSAGVWRRIAIEDPAVGGWQTDTLCEDLDLAYRAQMAGWSALYLADLTAPAEVPPQLMAFKRQQARWACGSVQTLRKLAAPVWASGWPLVKRVAALIHLGNYLVHPMLLLLAITLVMLTLTNTRPPAMLAALSLASFGPPILYAVSQRILHSNRWLRNWSVIVLLSMFGIGLSVGNTAAVAQGLRSNGGEFARTPKFRVMNPDDPWRASAYRLRVDRQLIAEVAMALFCVLGVATAVRNGDLLGSLYVLLFAASYAAMAGATLWQARRQSATSGDAVSPGEPAGRNMAHPG